MIHRHLQYHNVQLDVFSKKRRTQPGLHNKICTHLAPTPVWRWETPNCMITGVLTHQRNLFCLPGQERFLCCNHSAVKSVMWIPSDGERLSMSPLAFLRRAVLASGIKSSDKTSWSLQNWLWIPVLPLSQARLFSSYFYLFRTFWTYFAKKTGYFDRISGLFFLCYDERNMRPGACLHRLFDFAALYPEQGAPDVPPLFLKFH